MSELIDDELAADDLDQFYGTEPHKLRRNDHPETSNIAAHGVDSAAGEAIAYDIILSFGLHGCILDELREEFQRRTPPHTQFVNRRTGLHQKGRVLRQHLTRKGASNYPQHVYVARELLHPDWIIWMKYNHGWLNPCLFAEGEEVPLDPNSSKAIIRDLADDVIRSIKALMIEAGCYTENIGKPYATEDSSLGRALRHLGKPMPLIEPW